MQTNSQQHKQAHKKRPTLLASLSILFGITGFFASFELLTEYIKTLVEPDYLPNCNISVLVTCGPNMDSWQGSVLGFSNTIIGIAAFTIPIIIGFALFAGATFSAWFWRLYLVGLLTGYGFIHWLAYQSIFSLNTLCPWCMVVWLAMIPLWWTTVTSVASKGYIGSSSALKRVATNVGQWGWVIILINYILIAAIAQFKMNWLFTEFGIGSY